MSKTDPRDVADQVMFRLRQRARGHTIATEFGLSSANISFIKRIMNSNDTALIDAWKSKLVTTVSARKVAKLTWKDRTTFSRLLEWGRGPGMPLLDRHGQYDSAKINKVVEDCAKKYRDNPWQFSAEATRTITKTEVEDFYCKLAESADDIDRKLLEIILSNNIMLAKQYARDPMEYQFTRPHFAKPKTSDMTLAAYLSGQL